VQPGAVYKIVEYAADRQPQLRDVKKVAIHPAFNMQAITAHRATAVWRLLQLEAPPNGKNAADLGVPQVPIVAGSRFTIAGIGVAIRGEGKSAGPFASRAWSRPANPGPCKSAWSIRSDRVRGEGLAPVPGIRGPVFEDRHGSPAIVGVISWSTGPNGSAGCGGLTASRRLRFIATGYCRPRANGVLRCEVAVDLAHAQASADLESQLSAVPAEERILESVELTHGPILHQRNRQPANQTFGAPVEFGLSPSCDSIAGDHAPCSNPRATGLSTQGHPSLPIPSAARPLGSPLIERRPDS